jgi:hypothetical protein
LKLHCPDCEQNLMGEDYDLDAGTARCRRCDRVLALPSLSEPKADVRALTIREDPTKQRLEAPIERGARLEIARIALPIGGLAIFCAFLAWGTHAFVPLLVGALTVLVFLRWRPLRTRVMVDGERLRVTHPLHRAVSVRLADVVAVEADEQSLAWHHIRPAWTVKLLTSDRRSVELPLDLPSLAEARAAAAWIESLIAGRRQSLPD